jgi:hypothetical protein
VCYKFQLLSVFNPVSNQFFRYQDRLMENYPVFMAHNKKTPVCLFVNHFLVYLHVAFYWSSVRRSFLLAFRLLRVYFGVGFLVIFLGFLVNLKLNCFKLIVVLQILDLFN